MRYINKLRETPEPVILPESRIMSVADVVEAMFSHRPYRPRPGLETCGPKACASTTAARSWSGVICLKFEQGVCNPGSRCFPEIRTESQRG